MTSNSPFIVSPDWLAQHLHDPGLSIIDASWYLPDQNRDARAEFNVAHIPGAVFFDQDEVVEPDTGLPHSLPSPIVFEQHVSAMGISRDDTIIVYDGPGYFSAPRIWWMFRLMGADKVLLLDGGFDGWRREGRIVTAQETNIAPTAFIPEFQRDRVASFDDMRSIVADGSVQIADARPAGRFTGEVPEPRAGIRSGHMPGAVNVPFNSLSEDGRLKDEEALRDIFEKAGLDLDKPVVTSCGSGVTAAVITLALQSIGHRDNRLYDGSWSEWGSRDDTDIVTGKAQP